MLALFRKLAWWRQPDLSPMGEVWGRYHARQGGDDAASADDIITAIRFCSYLLICGLSCLLALLVGLTITSSGLWRIPDTLDGCELAAICERAP